MWGIQLSMVSVYRHPYLKDLKGNLAFEGTTFQSILENQNHKNSLSVVRKKGCSL